MKVAIIGTVGVPGRYGGFETLADNLVTYFAEKHAEDQVTVYCSKPQSHAHPATYKGADLVYIGLRANGIQSIVYDWVSMLRAVWRGHDTLLILGVSGATLLPLIRLVSRARIVTNIDGIEWKRAKWNRLARFILRLSERVAVRWSHVVVADNKAIADYVQESYGQPCETIAYGGDHAVEPVPDTDLDPALPETYALALCRIEPENNVDVILEAWKGVEQPLVFVGNWNGSAYGRAAREACRDAKNMWLLDPVYDPAQLFALRKRAALYVHGHSAGGTNPSLVEMMHFQVPVIAHDCRFNRCTTRDEALFFKDAADLAAKASALTPEDADRIGTAMRQIAEEDYVWTRIGERYAAHMRTRR